MFDSSFKIMIARKKIFILYFDSSICSIEYNPLSVYKPSFTHFSLNKINKYLFFLFFLFYNKIRCMIYQKVLIIIQLFSN